jgi:hypothetical protein
MLRRLICRFLWCSRCALHDVPEGIGGKCVDCGAIHGWVTRDELLAYGERATRRAP